jgi:hypothetical protein
MSQNCAVWNYFDTQHGIEVLAQAFHGSEFKPNFDSWNRLIGLLLCLVWDTCIPQGTQRNKPRNGQECARVMKGMCHWMEGIAQWNEICNVPHGTERSESYDETERLMRWNGVPNRRKRIAHRTKRIAPLERKEFTQRCNGVCHEME